MVEAIRGSSMVFVAVGTPTNQDGSKDLRAVTQVANTIGSTMSGSKTVVI